MIKINQHRLDDCIVDAIQIGNVLRSISPIYQWCVAVEWCVGDDSGQIENTAREPIYLSDSEFVEYYKNVTQTIDAEFVIDTNDGQVRASIIDSSYWEIESDNLKLEMAFKGGITIDISAQQGDSAEASTIAVPHSDPPGSPR